MSKYTPGPWRLVETEHEKIISDWDIEIGDYKFNVFPYRRIYSEDRTQSGLVNDSQKMADARLIAAAPDLLDALITLVDCVDGNYKDVTDLARAAIAKATGEMK